jgi:myo-inositol-1(or 4)-monophosphatase
MTAVDLDAFFHKMADAAGDAILPFFRTSLAARNKATGGHFDPVTEADKAAEVIIRRIIAAAFPEHGIEGEEFGLEREESEFRWIIDPIDGTRAFLAGLPVWGSLVGLMRGGTPVMGMMSQPFTGERFWGDGSKAQARSPLGERRLKTRSITALGDAILSTTSPRIIPTALRERYDRVEGAVRLARYGLDCYAYCMVASGHMDIVIEAGLNAYDIVPLIPVIEGAGGVVTTWSGENPARGGDIVASANERLHEQVLKILAG